MNGAGRARADRAGERASRNRRAAQRDRDVVRSGDGGRVLGGVDPQSGRGDSGRGGVGTR